MTQPHLDTSPPIIFGMHAPAVSALQTALNLAGATPRLVVDGIYGVRTRAAVASYQRIAGLTVSGVADLPTLASLTGNVPTQAPASEPAPKFIQARNYTPGRTGPIRLVVLHTTENGMGPGVAAAVARWFASAAAPNASTHYTVGPDEVVQSVCEEDTAWHAPPTNGYAIGVEHVGRASFTAAQWAEPEAVLMLRRSARLVAGLCHRHGIPVALLDVAALRRGDAGIATHDAVSKAFGQSNHWDVGAGFPMLSYLEWVRASMG